MEKNRRRTLIKSLLSDKLTKEKKKSFLELDSVNAEIKKQWNESGKEPVGSIVKEQIWNKVKARCGKKPKRKVHAELWYVIAASIALLLIVGALWVNSLGDKMQSDEMIKIVANEDKTYLLPDSSKVWMQSGSSIQFHKAFNENRKVWLSGNSLFEVYKHSDSTFRVYIDKAFIEVKGTSFLVKQNNATDNEITLFNGKIEFNVEATGKKTVMIPNQRMIYNPSTSQTEIQTITYVNWENGKYNFTDIPLTQLIQVIHQMYESNIILSKGVDKESAFTGSIRYNEPLEDVINKICFSLNLKQERKNNKIIIIQN